MEDKKLISLREKLAEFVSGYDEFMGEYKAADYITENKRIRNELLELQQRLQKLEAERDRAENDARRLRLALTEQIIDEKLNIIKHSRQKLETYFTRVNKEGENALTATEKHFLAQANKLKEQARNNLGRDSKQFIEQLSELSLQLQEKIRARKLELEKERQLMLDGALTQLDSLAAQEVDEKQILARMKQNELEVKIGLNWFNRIGILLILFGVGAAFRYTYATWFNDYLKGIVFYLLGAVLLFGGEWFYQRRKTTFSTGLLSGGIGVLYSSTFFSHFQLGIIHENSAVLLTLLISLIAVLLSLRYNSRAICSLGFVGGYFPFISYSLSYGPGGINYWAAMGYLLALNVSVLLISLHKRWNVVNYISFGLHLPSFIFLAVFNPSVTSGMVYALLFFALYLAVTLAYPLKHKLALQTPDVVLLGLNTFFSCVILYGLLEKAGWGNYRGALALAFSLIYALLAQFAERLTKERAAVTLFYATALTFAVLMVPFQFGLQWAAVGWLVEGVMLTVFGYTRQVKQLERAGLAIFGLSLATFYYFDFPSVVSAFQPAIHFHFKYFMVTAGMLLTLWVYLKGRQANAPAAVIHRYLDYYNYLVLANLWFYLVYSGLSLFDVFVPHHQLTHFYQVLLFSLITFGTGFAYSKITLIADSGTRLLCAILYSLGSLAVLYLNISVPVLSPLPFHTAAQYTALGILIAYNLLVLVTVQQALLTMVRGGILDLEVYPLLLGLWLVGNVTAFLTVQFRLSSVNLTFSIVYLLMAAGFVIYGLNRRFNYLRRFGLGLAMFALAKLFLYDLSYLTSLSKIAAYFSFGIILVAISYLYQKLEKGREVESDVQKM